jgi:hypothetical protein
MACRSRRDELSQCIAGRRGPANQELGVMRSERDFDNLLSYLLRVPAIRKPVATGNHDNGNWWVKFSIDISHPLAWSVVQEFGCVLNYLSLAERLPTVFIPVSPAPYLNGGPMEFLSWVIESKDPEFNPDSVAEWLEGRLPRPVDDVAQWGKILAHDT